VFKFSAGLVKNWSFGCHDMSIGFSIETHPYLKRMWLKMNRNRKICNRTNGPEQFSTGLAEPQKCFRQNSK